MNLSIETFDAAMIRELAPTGRLRASLNMANALLARSRTSVEVPAGVTIDLARELGRRLGIPVDFQQWESPGVSVDALAQGRADIGFLAVDPKRAEAVRFTTPYLQIEAWYMAGNDLPLHDQADVDRPGMDVIVLARSAYDLYLTRTLQHARLVRHDDLAEVVQALLHHSGSAVAAGVKQALLAIIKTTRGLRLLDGHFLAIMQAMVLPREIGERTAGAVEDFLDDLQRSGFIADALMRHGVQGATVLSRSNRKTAVLRT